MLRPSVRETDALQWAVMRIWPVLYLCLALCLGGFPAQAQRLEVEAPASLEPLAARLRSLDPAKLEGAARLVGLEDPGPPIRVILAEEGSPPAAGVPPWVAGYALSERGIVVLLPARSPSYPDSSMDDLLRHEVAHVLIARASGSTSSEERRLPRWFHEGVAMIAGLSWGLDESSRLMWTLLRGNEVPLAEVERAFGGSPAAVRAAYTASGAFVRDLLAEHGQEVVGEILDGVASGLPFDEAFRQATGMTLAAAEGEFWDRQTFWYRWVPFLTSSAVLWIAVTLLALWAMQRRRARDVARMARWAEEEARIPPPDPQPLRLVRATDPPEEEEEEKELVN
jgi:hypothetical protein